MLGMALGHKPATVRVRLWALAVISQAVIPASIFRAPLVLQMFARLERHRRAKPEMAQARNLAMAAAGVHVATSPVVTPDTL